MKDFSRDGRRGRRLQRGLIRAHGFTLLELLIASSLLLTILFALYTVFESSQRTYASGVTKIDVQQNARVALELMERDIRMTGYGFPTDTAVMNPQLKITAATPTSITFWADLTNASTVLSADVNPGTTTFAVANGSKITSGDTIYLINGGQWQPLTVSSVNASANPNTISVVSPGASAFYPRGSQVGRPKAIIYSWNAGTISKDDGEGGGLQPFVEGVQAFQFRHFNAADLEIPSGSLAANLATIRRIMITITVQASSSQNPQTFTLSSDVRPRNL